MNKADVILAKKKILKCLTEDFPYGKTKAGKPRKHPLQNRAIFDKGNGHGIWQRINLEMVMEAVILGLYFAMDDSELDKGECDDEQ